MRWIAVEPVYGLVCESAVGVHHGLATAAAACPRAESLSEEFRSSAATPMFARSMLIRQITAASALSVDCEYTGVSAPVQLLLVSMIAQRTVPMLAAFCRVPLHSTEADWPGWMVVASSPVQ